MYNQSNTSNYDNVIWNITGEDNIRKRYIIPVGKLSKEESENSIRELMSSYKDVSFTESMILFDDLENDIFSIIEKYKGKTIDVELVDSLTKTLIDKINGFIDPWKPVK